MSIKTKNSFTIKHITRQGRYYRYFATGLGAFLLAYICASIIAPVQTSNAAQVVQAEIGDPGTYYVTVTGEDVVTIGGPEGVSGLQTGQMAGAKDTLHVVTNSRNGYRLMISAATPNLINASDNTKFFEATNHTMSSPGTLTKDTWGFGINLNLSTSETAIPPADLAVWGAVPTEATQISQGDGENESAGGTDVDVYYAINVSNKLPSGTYQNTITYTVFSEGIDEDIITGTYMQDFTMETCDAMNTGRNIYLKDKRDDKTYRITKLADGNCWMTSNLQLDGLDGDGNPRKLTSADSNVTSDYTFPSNVQQINDGSTASINTNAQIYTLSQNSKTSGETDQYSTYGNYYNFFAATAGAGTATATGTITQDICPRGWRLPDNTGNKSYSNLMGAYDLPTTNTEDADAVAKVQQSPLYFPLAGHYYSSIANHGVAGSYWSRTVYSSSDRAYHLGFNAGDGYFGPQHDLTSKPYALSVRCVFNGQSTDMLQNFTTEMCNNLSFSTYASDNRRTFVDARDGKTYKIARLKDKYNSDGYCWMVQNLALDGLDADGKPRTLTTADTSLDTTEIPAGSITFESNIQQINDGTTTSSYDTPQIYTNDQNTTQTNVDGEKLPYGNYYNWTAATATVGKQATTSATTVKSSICPKGWRLPDNGTASGLKSYSNLVVNYTTNVDGTGDTLSPDNVTNAVMIARIQRAPLYFPLAGRYYSVMGYQGVSGHYWSRTVYRTSDNVYYLYLNNTSSDSSFYPQGSYYKFSAYSVRCVFGS